MIEQPILRPINKKEFVLWEDYPYQWENEKLVVKRGFVTDLASIPKPFWSFGSLQPGGLNSGAAVIHDALYQLRGYISLVYPMVEYYTRKDPSHNWERSVCSWNRLACDNIFKRILEDSGVDWWTKGSMYNSVRVFGHFAW